MANLKNIFQGCEIKELNEKYLQVSGSGFSFYVRTESASWQSPKFRTIFIYDYESNSDENLLSYLDSLKSKVQILIYAQGKDFASKLSDKGFKETNRFIGKTVDINEELKHIPPSSCMVELVGSPSSNQIEIIKRLSQNQLRGVNQNLQDHSSSSFTWFDSQYCPKNFHLNFEDDDVLYGLAKKDGEYVALAKILKPVPGFDNPKEVEIEMESYAGCSSDEFHSALYPMLISYGYSQFYFRHNPNLPSPSKTFKSEDSIHIMEFGKSAFDWGEDKDKTNPLQSKVWHTKRKE